MRPRPISVADNVPKVRYLCTEYSIWLPAWPRGIVGPRLDVTILAEDDDV
jgi:hypothetical protein